MRNIDLPNEPVFALRNKEKVSPSKIIDGLKEQEVETVWAKKTNQYAIDKVSETTEKYGDFWYKGLLPTEFLFDILLPSHSHDEKDGETLFPDGTTLREAVIAYKNRSSEYSQDCVKAIEDLKAGINKYGLKREIILYIEGGKLKHIDGLHRMIAIALLIEEGFGNGEITVFLLDSTK